MNAELGPALAVHCHAVLEKNWRRISIYTCCSKEEGIGELGPALAVHCPAVLERVGEGFRSIPAVLKRKGLESWL